MRQVRSVIHKKRNQGVLRGDGLHPPPSVFPSELDRLAQPLGGIPAPVFSQFGGEPQSLRAPPPAGLASPAMVSGESRVSSHASGVLPCTKGKCLTTISISRRPLAGTGGSNSMMANLCRFIT